MTSCGKQGVEEYHPPCSEHLDHTVDELTAGKECLSSFFYFLFHIHSVCKHGHSTKSYLSRHGIHATLMSDNGSQLDCPQMKELSESYQFCNLHYPQSNGLVERNV